MVKEPETTPKATQQGGLYRFTVEQYHKMGETGILSPDDKTELIDGQIVTLMPIGKDHASIVTNLMLALVRGLPKESATVMIQNPLSIGDLNEPVPDAMVLEFSPNNYRDHLPKPENALLVIEVSNSTIKYDREIKLPKYAGSGVKESWIVDINGQKVWVYKQPSADGYLQSQAYERSQSLTVLELTISVDEILG